MSFISHTNLLPAIVIPAYQPDEQLVTLIKNLREQRPTQPIIVVDDGSDPVLHPLFTMLADYQVEIVRHAVNLGKGQALKTAFNHYLNVFGQHAIGVVTADADGQHSVEDILALTTALINAPQELHLGVRGFQLKNVPWRSKIGNAMTGFVFRQVCTSNLRDTQTGLRGIPSQLMRSVLKRKAMGYDLELEMLLLAAEQHLKINQIAIKTIYIANNAASHFNPLMDSIKIYLVFVRYSSLSVFSTILDFSVFLFSYGFFQDILSAVILGRVIAASFNFKWNRRRLFKKRVYNSLSGILRYSLTTGLLAFVIYGLINTINKYGFNILYSKIAAELLLLMSMLSVSEFFTYKRNTVESKNSF